MTRILVLGSGLVARPLVRYLLDLPDVRLTVATNEPERGRALVAGHPRGEVVEIDASDDEALDRAVAGHDVVVSLLPAPFHPRVARACLRHRRHLLTASYISPEMRALDEEARRAGLVFLNECGVDPGIDHMTAMCIFDDVRRRGGRIVSFKSYCGGLPAPEADDNPLGYKFSWAPRGVLQAARRPARYRWEGEVREVPPDGALEDVHEIEVEGAGTFEARPNRDSLEYEEIYGLEGVRTLYRGTLRKPGHCARFKSWVDLGLFDEGPLPEGTRTRADVVRAALGRAEGDPRRLVAERLGVPEDHDHVESLGWVGMFDEEPVGGRVRTPMGALAEAMVERMSYAPGERDMVVMHHEVEAEFPDHRECVRMDLVDFGQPGGDSSMARTVSLPLAIATRLVVEGKVRARGVVRPTTPDLYVPILDELEQLGIRVRERVERLPLEGEE